MARLTRRKVPLSVRKRTAQLRNPAYAAAMNDRITYEDILRIFQRPLDQARRLALVDSEEYLHLVRYLATKVTKH